MLPRPRLFCQEPWLRPIGRSPGVSDKSNRGLGSMYRYSAQILICFIAYIFSFFFSSVGLVGDFAELPSCSVPSAIAHSNQNEAGHQTIKVPSMPCWDAANPNTYAIGLVNLTDKIDKIGINEKLSVQEPSKRRAFCIPARLWVVLLYFSLESWLIPAMLELIRSSCFEK